MLNLELGTPSDVDGRVAIVTARGRRGHAVYGPYSSLEPGGYVVEFQIAAMPGEAPARDVRCAVIDVARSTGSEILARKKIYFSQLAQGRTGFALPFTLDRRSNMEFRVWVSGDVSLTIDDYTRVMATAADTDTAALLAATGFPEEAGAAVPFFVTHQAMLRGLYQQGMGVAIHQGHVVLTVAGVSLYARSLDDLNFVGEVFFENAYNLKLDRPLCMIDIGMNIGLSSLMFAAKPEVQEVWSFEPFLNTYDRAVDNIALNPALAPKIHVHSVGLSDRDVDDTIVIGAPGDSGSASTVAVPGGIPVHVTLKDAGTLLAPIIRDARARGLAVVLKVDCEGSEFAIFESLRQHGLFGAIDGFMVEWHRMFGVKTQEDLIAPLRAAGFLVFDRSPPTGNGFFYAARIAG